MKRFTVSFALVVAAVFNTVSFAEEKSSAEEKPLKKPSDRPAAPALFRKLDQNGDGKLVADEVPADRRFFFERLLKTSDTDSDGVITREEFAAGFAKRGRVKRSDQPRPERQRRRARPDAPNRPQGPRGAQLFKRLDTNGDGRITREEFPEARQARFDRMLEKGDQNGDGALSREELARAVAGGRPQPSPGARKRTARRAGGPAGKLFALLDADRDGKLTRAELKKVLKLVTQLDTDGDEAVSAAEIMAASPLSAAAQQRRAKVKKGVKKGVQTKRKKASEETAKLKKL